MYSLTQLYTLHVLSALSAVDSFHDIDDDDVDIHNNDDDGEADVSGHVGFCVVMQYFLTQLKKLETLEKCTNAFLDVSG